MQDEAYPQPDATAIMTRIVAAYVTHNPLPRSELPRFIETVYRELAGVYSRSKTQAVAPRLSLPVRKSITPDYLISYEDGQQYRSLTRHLTSRGLTPDAYRAKWGLPSDYPMEAPSLSRRRAEVARLFGRGRIR